LKPSNKYSERKNKMTDISPNQDKKLIIEVDGISYERIPIKTHVVTPDDDIADVAKKYASPHIKEGDILFVSEKCTAASQKRAIPVEEIHPRKLAAVAGAVGRVFRRKGWFYVVAGRKAATIDGPADYVIPPYNGCVVLSPAEPDKTAKSISEKTGIEACIVDINDFNGEVMGRSSTKIDKTFIIKVLKDNPLGQTRQQTPMGLIRKA
jgi:hypothetical protein